MYTLASNAIRSAFTLNSYIVQSPGSQALQTGGVKA
jgi:hypothetical protein